MTLTLIPELKIDIAETKKYIEQISDWTSDKGWACKFHHVDPNTLIYQNLMGQMLICPGKLVIQSIYPKSDFQIHIDDIRNASILIPIDGDFHMAPISFYTDVENGKKLLSCNYEIGSAVLIDPAHPHGVHNPSERYRTNFVINIRDPYTYESMRTAYLNGTLIK